jgi:hypothetical protein
MERRHFLKLFSAAAPVSTAAALEFEHNRKSALLPGSKNIANPAEAARMRALMQDFVSYPDPAIRGLVDRRAHADYDLMLIPAGETVPEWWPFFSEPLGAARRGRCNWCGHDGSVPLFRSKTMLDTNMHLANSFPPPQARYHERVLFIFSPEMDEADRNDLATRFSWEYRMADRVMASAPLILNRVMGDIGDLVSLVTGKRKPVPIEAPYCAEFRKPVYIPSLAHFSLDLRATEGSGFVARKQIALYAFLDGVGDFGI